MSYSRNILQEIEETCVDLLVDQHNAYIPKPDNNRQTDYKHKRCR